MSNTERSPIANRQGAQRAGARTTEAPPLAFVYLAVMIISWAGNWPLMKLALGQLPPLLFVLLRLIGSLILIAPALAATQQPLLPVRGERLGLLCVGELQVAGFLVFSIIGLALLPAGRAIVLAYTMPLWAIPIGLFLWPEPLGRNQLVGAAIGFAGLVLFMKPSLIDWGNRRILAGNALLLLAAIAWALGSCLYGRRSWGSPFWVQTLWQLAVRPGRRARANGRGRRTDKLVVGGRRYPRLQLHYHHRPRLFSVGQGLIDDVGGDSRTNTDADPDRWLRAVRGDLRWCGDARRRAQHRINRRRYFRDPATVVFVRGFFTGVADWRSVLDTR
jgi:hypothetical protein